MPGQAQEFAYLNRGMDERSLDSTEDWFDPTDSGRLHVQYKAGAGSDLKNSFDQRRKSWFEDDFEKADLQVIRRDRRRKFFILGIFSVFTIFAAVTVSFLVAKSKTKEEKATEIEDAKRTAGFHPITESLVSACSLKSIQSVSGKKLCEEMCSVADCCMIPDGQKFSCYADRKKDCNDYHRVCSAYDLPDNQLNNTDDFHLAEKIITTCKSDNLLKLEGEKECAKLCEPHQCCFEEDETKSCIRDPAEKCHLYSGCFTLMDEIEETVFGNVYKQCNQAALNSVEQFNKCHSLCAPHLCCFSSDPAENCANEHNDVCISYSPCATLTNSSLAIEDNKKVENTFNDTYEYVAEKCSKDKLHDEEALQGCHETCANAMCCFSHDDMKSNCRDSLGEDICNTYRPCEILANGDEDPSNIVAGPDLGNIPELCKRENMLDPEAKKMCEDTCEKAECCFEHGGCFQQDPNWCLSFDSCKNLGHKFVSYGTKHITKKETQAAEITDICSLDNFGEKFGQDSARG